jgi:hypothetical protein
MSFKKQYKNIKLYFSFSLLEKMNIQPNFYYLSMDDIDLNLNLSSLLLFESDGYMSESTETLAASLLLPVIIRKQMTRFTL